MFEYIEGVECAGDCFHVERAGRHEAALLDRRPLGVDKTRPERSAITSGKPLSAPCGPWRDQGTSATPCAASWRSIQSGMTE